MQAAMATREETTPRGQADGKLDRYASYRCRRCGVEGHLERACRRATVTGQNALVEACEEAEVAGDIFKVDTHKGCSRGFVAQIEIMGKMFNMQVDTGSCVTTLSRSVFKKSLPNVQLEVNDILLRGYTGSMIRPLGYFVANVKAFSKVRTIKNYVVDSIAPCLLVRDFLSAFNMSLNINSVSQCSHRNRLLREYPDVLTKRLRTYKYDNVTIPIDPQARPIFLRHRPVPLAYRKKVEDQIRRMVEEGILEPITNSRWATPIVPVIKANGTVRICGDYMATVNKWLDKNIHYPLPRINEIFDLLSGGNLFTKLDLNQAYTQLMLSEESKEAMTLTTHLGFFRTNRMLFGVSPAAALFQMTIEQVLQGLKGVAVFADDICITGESTQKHIRNCEEVLQRLREAGLTVRPKKFKFFERVSEEE